MKTSARVKVSIDLGNGMGSGHITISSKYLKTMLIINLKLRDKGKQSV